MNKVNVTDARKDMSAFFDSVIHEKPVILKRRKYEAVLAEKSMLCMMLEYAVIKVSINEQENKVVARAIDLDIISEAETRIDAIDKLIDSLIEYSNDVYNNFMFYFYGQNIRVKLPYIFNVLLCETKEDVKKLLVFSTKSTKKNK